MQILTVADPTPRWAYLAAIVALAVSAALVWTADVDLLVKFGFTGFCLLWVWAAGPRIGPRR